MSEEEEFDDSTGIPAPDEVGSETWKQTAYAAILRDIASDFENERFNAIALIEHFEGDPRLQPMLSRLLASRERHLLMAGLMAVGEWRHSEGASMVIDFLTDAGRREEMTPDVEEEAILALGHVGGSESTEYLRNYAMQRYLENPDGEDPRGMAAIEGLAHSASRGDESALRFLIDQMSHPSWNMREACADAIGIVFKGRESIPKLVYDTLVKLTQDTNRNVQIAAYMSLDEIVGLDEANKKILAAARQKQIFGE